MPQYAIGDIHGCSKTFKELLNKIGLNEGDELYLLGDYIDRGPDSKGVIDIIWALRDKGFKVICLRGNHESMLLDALKNREEQKNFMRNGGKQTLQSFDTVRPIDLPKEYIDFFESLPFYHEVGDCILVHAGLNFLEADPLTDTEAMMWIRNWYRWIDYNWLENRIILHGHTPISLLEMIDQCENIAIDKYVNLDGGCYKNCYLCAFDMTEKKLIAQKCIDEVNF